MFGERIVDFRKNKKLTQEELAKKLKITRSALSQYELGTRQPDYDTLKKIADFFETSIDYLLGRTDDPQPYAKDLEESIKTGRLIKDIAGYIFEDEHEKQELPFLLADLDPDLVHKFIEAMKDTTTELFFDNILSASKEEREELIREFLTMRKSLKKRQN